MIAHGAELHPFAQLRAIPGRPGRLLQRVPERVRLNQKPRGQERYTWPAGGEIRFVAGGKPVVVTLAAFGGPAAACVYHGDHQAAVHRFTETPAAIEVPPPGRPLPPHHPGGRGFDPGVTRLILEGQQVHLLDIRGDGLRPPRPEELPSLRYLAYGTSITQGMSATTPVLHYARQTAWRLGADLLNFGIAGSAFSEPDLADFLADELDWDFATLCLSVNMYNQNVSLEEFRGRASYMVRRLAGSGSGRIVACISLLPFFGDLPGQAPVRTGPDTPSAFRDALRSVVAESGMANLHFIDGPELLRDTHGLSADLLHPGDLGMIEIGENLAARLRPLLERPTG